ncbi:MAG: CDP-diacylglycerol--glycerol-3-phosphate 3-phosphatidyltransferase (EC [uncultured Thiotrichaceae bacterium]|uniref:CDP-diacylglycerol--glycerol-3-phosphate 3-phosphatidyltransferase n=1 Tax=uncultured Thiotrichaceae bacterium TaxID=298394 RepID=A0A6S6TTC5_9GAMM|nr:MAG: CDP-diacylglycerol--glycerol-3-phosphate 3-phosphatidyltransferase (EC [uncultured Thiotrichaceae bacterium]
MTDAMLRQIPNIITLTRIVAIFPICWLLLNDDYAVALICLVLAGLSDGLDGFLARRYGWFTSLGAVLDPLADKLFIIALIIVFAMKGHVPLWLMWLVIGRDIVIVSGALIYRWVTGVLEMKPLFISKLNTALQILLLAATLMHVGLYALAPEIREGLQLLVAATSLLSGLMYVFLWTYDAFNKEVSA